MVGDRIYAADETGQFSVYNADPMNFEILAQNKLGDQVFATPTIVGGRIYARVAENEGGKRQEKLYCLGGK